MNTRIRFIAEYSGSIGWYVKWLNEKAKSADIYVDLGTANTLVVTRLKGLVVNEPSVIAYRDLGWGRKEVIAVGNEAKEKIGRTAGNLVACHPLKDGVIADLDVTEAMLKYFLTKASGSFRFMKPRLVVSLPYGVSDVEKKAVIQAGFAAGARETVLIEEPIAAALGVGLPVPEPEGSMIIDIGGGTTEIAVISLCGIVHCEAVRIGGHGFDAAIVEYVRRRHNLVIGDQSAEKLKIQIGSALSDINERWASVRGIDFATGLPRSIDIEASEVSEALNASLTMIVDAGKRAMEMTPPELISDLIHRGAVVAGGGALVRGIDQRLQSELGLPVRVADHPLLAIAQGGQRVIHDPGLLQRIALR